MDKDGFTDLLVLLGGPFDGHFLFSNGSGAGVMGGVVARLDEL